MAAPRLTALRYYYCDVSGSNLFPNSPGRNLYAALIRRCMHKGLELFSYLNLSLRRDPTLLSNPLPSLTLPAFTFF